MEMHFFCWNIAKQNYCRILSGGNFGCDKMKKIVHFQRRYLNAISDSPCGSIIGYFSCVWRSVTCSKCLERKERKRNRIQNRPFFERKRIREAWIRRHRVFERINKHTSDESFNDEANKIAHKMRDDGLYSQKTVICDIANAIKQQYKRWLFQ